MARKVAIYGGGGHGREILQLIKDINGHGGEFYVEGFLIDGNFPAPEDIHGYPVLGDMSWLVGRNDVEVVIAVGDPSARYRIAKRVEEVAGSPFATLIHPSAIIGEHVLVDSGAVIFAGCQLTTDIKVGAHAHINIGCMISHDVVMEPFVTVGPGSTLTGYVRVCEGVNIGAGAVIIPKTVIEKWSVVGAGAVVTKLVPPNATVVGVPARVIKYREHGWHY